MHDVTATSPTMTAGTGWLRRTARWMATFVGFPLGGLASMLLVGPVDSLPAALIGGLITGLFVGAAQAWGLGPALGRANVLPWIAATAIGMTVGLGIGSSAVGFASSLTALAVQGAISGLAVGLGQAFVLRAKLGRPAAAWPPALGAIWAIGWTITTLGGIAVQEQFTVFGSFGAITVTALTLPLPFLINRTGKSAS